MTYRKAAREGLSYRFIGSMHKMMTLDVHFPGICVWVDRQTYTLIAILCSFLYWGQSNDNVDQATTSEGAWKMFTKVESILH